jgi:hypothetical protein
MSSNLSVAEILANLEAKLAHHREQEAFHASQEVHHREQRAVHAAETEAVSQHLEAFKAVALPAAEMARPQAPSAPDDSDLGPRPLVSHMVTRVVSSRPAGEVFGPTAIAAAVYQRFAGKLKKRADGRLVSITLRRLRDEGQIRLVQKGKAHTEALYTKG